MPRLSKKLKALKNSRALAVIARKESAVILLRYYWRSLIFRWKHLLEQYLLKRPSNVPIKYDPTKLSLISLSNEILQDQILPLLDTLALFQIFNSCRFFRDMIDVPSRDNHHIWNLNSSIISLLNRGISTGWIQGIKYWVLSDRDAPDECQGCREKSGTWYWDYRAAFCAGCLPKHTIGFDLAPLTSAIMMH
jgi:hypothetical protein